MLSKSEFENAKIRTLEYFYNAGIAISESEREKIEVADFGLNRLNEIGLEILMYVNTERCCAKELILFPYQICPEHRHPDINGKQGKEETFRCRYGKVFLYVEGEPSENIFAVLPKGKENSFTIKHEIVLNPGDQYTLRPGILHWFQAGPEGAVVSEFSTKSSDEFDIFTDQEIKRIPEIEG
ncbi:MAG: D-lyxose/D-mannose family sugar isomerase [Ignavibacteriaceae bacterium]|nr:D-lyxose/D-mannose family sugar isomerase [Ignavibacteriaceae bacterium]